MTQTVFKVDRSKAAEIPKITEDEIVSRLSITTRDSNALGMKEDCVFVLVDGQEEGIKRAKEMFETKMVGQALPEQEAAKVADAVSAEEESAAEGMGNLFG